MVRVTSSGSGMAVFDTAPDTLTTSSGSGSSSSTSPILTTPVLLVASAAKLSTRFELSLKSASVAGATGLADTVTVKATGEAGDTFAVTGIHPAFSRGSSALRCSVTSSPGGIGMSTAFVRTASEGSDQSLSVSPFFARTCTWYSVFAVSPVMVVVTPVPLCAKFVQLPPVCRYSTA